MYGSRSKWVKASRAYWALFVGACWALAAPAVFAQMVAVSEPVAIEKVPDLVYYDGDGYHPGKHCLDLYRPDIRHMAELGAPMRPVLVFVHGGGWMFGDKNHYGGLYGNIGRAFAERGYLVAVINYRLSSRRRGDVRHPEHVRDVARAVAWIGKNVASYGGDPRRMVVAGHSAGGHLVSLLATDPRFLSEVGLDRSAFRGVVSISGVYDVVGIPGITSAFGDDDAERKLASPIFQVDASDATLPYLLIVAENDLPGLDGGARDFARELRGVDAKVELEKIEDCSHQSIVIAIGRDGDVTTERVATFLREALD
ncbi:MAG: alpha/beta hydrolase [Planctomycetota bacterium]